MTIIKTIKDALIIVSFLAIGILIHQKALGSRVGQLFSAYPNHNLLELKTSIILLLVSLLGTYWYIGKNILIDFKSKTIIFVLIGFSILLSYSSLSLYVSGNKLIEEVLAVYHHIPFPTAQDDIERNIRLSVIQYAQYLFLSSLVTGLVGLILGNYQLLKKSARIRKRMEQNGG